MEKNFGLAFPIELEDGSIKPPDLKTSIRSNILVSIFWPKGTRPFNNQFSLDLSPYIGEPNDGATENIIRKEIFKVVSLYEKRIEILSLNFANNEETLNISMRARIKDTQETVYMEL